MYATNEMERKFLETMRGVNLPANSSFFIGLFLSNPGEAGAGVEITYPGYERKPITFTPPAEQSGGIGIKNDKKIDFPESDADAGTVTHIGIFDSRVGGTMLLYGQLTEELPVQAKQTPVLLEGEVIYYMLGNLTNAYKTKFLNYFRGQPISGFTTHCSLFNGDPEDGGGELSGDNYARVPIAFDAPTESASGQMEMASTGDIAFNRPTSAWGTWTYTVFYDALTSGNPAWKQKLPEEQPLMRGYMPWIKASEIKVAIN